MQTVLFPVQTLTMTRVKDSDGHDLCEGHIGVFLHALLLKFLFMDSCRLLGTGMISKITFFFLNLYIYSITFQHESIITVNQKNTFRTGQGNKNVE